MAAGRCDVLRGRSGDDYFKKECEYHRNRDRRVNLCRDHDRGNWVPARGKGRMLVGTDGRIVEREVGDVSVRSRFDDTKDAGLGVCNGSKVKEEGLCRDKKRKFSPIVWDREDKEIMVSSKKRIIPRDTRLSPTPLPKSSSEVPNVILDACLQVNLSATNKLLALQILADEGVVANESLENTVSGSQGGSSSFLPQERCGHDEQEQGLVEDETFVKAHNISTSRWASVENSPRDLSDDEIYGGTEIVGRVYSSSPECGEFRREFSGSAGSDDVNHYMRSVSGDVCSEHESDGNDLMEIEERRGDSVGVKKLYSISDDDGYDSGAVPEQGKINMLQACRSVFEYEKLNKINEGTYGVVYRARDKITGEIMALKKVKMGKESEREGFPMTSLREINILLSFHHPSIVGVREVVTDNGGGVFMAMEYMEHDLKGVMERMKQPFSTSEVKCLMWQLLEGLKYLHDNWVIHRDLKTSNLLLNNRGELKICDFGLSRQYGSPLKPYTPLVVTLWYRAPELLLGTKQYSTAIDMWSVGCIMAELLAKEPLFKGKTEVDQLGKIFKTLGSPNETIWPGFTKLPGVKVNFSKQPYNMLRKKFPATSFTGSPVLSDTGFDLLNKLLTYDPEERITVDAALNHDWFQEVPLPKSKDFMPTFPVQHV